MTDMSKMMRLGLFSLFTLVVMLMAYFFWAGSARETARTATAEQPEAGENSTAAGVGITDFIAQGGIVGQPDGVFTPPPQEEDNEAVVTEGPTQTPSARAKIYEESELELLRRDLAADVEDKMARRELRKQAMRSPIGTSRITFEQSGNTNQTAPASALPAPAPSLRLADLAEQEARVALGDPAASPGTAPVAPVVPDSVASQPLANTGYSPHRIEAPLSPYELRKGTVIPGVLATGINSDIPGPASGTVRLDVYDTVSGRHLLIPAGSRIFGRYNEEIAYGQKRLEIAWTDLVFPDGDSIRLEGQRATDQAGQSGFADQRRGHFWRTLGGNLLYSIINAGEQGLHARLEEEITGGRPQEEEGLGDALERLGSGISGSGSSNTSAAAIFNRQQSQLKPTLIIRPGYRFNILVARDLVLEPRG